MITAGVGASGEQLSTKFRLVSGSYRVEFKGIKPTSDNYITVATDGGDIALGANPNNILDGVSGTRNLNGARITNAGAPQNSNDLATKSYVTPNHWTGYHNPSAVPRRVTPQLPTTTALRHSLPTPMVPALTVNH